MRFTDLKQSKRKLKFYTSVAEIKIDGTNYTIIQNLSTYAKGLSQRAYVKVNGILYKLPDDWDIR